MDKEYSYPQCWLDIKKPGIYITRDGGKLYVDEKQFQFGCIKWNAEAKYVCPKNLSHIWWLDLEEIAKCRDDFRCGACRDEAKTGIPCKYEKTSVRWIFKEYGFKMPDEDFADVDPKLRCFIVTIEENSFTVDREVDGEVVESITYS